MSIQAVAAVLDHSQAVKGARLTAISFANHADKNGVGFASIRLAAEEAKLSHSAAKNAMRKLREIGEIETVIGGHGKTHRPPLLRLVLPGLSGDVPDDHNYFLAFGPPHELQFDPGSVSDPGPGAHSDPDPGAPTDPPGGRGETPPGSETDPLTYKEPSFNRQVTKKEETPSSDPVVGIYDFWKASTGRNGGTVLTSGRRRAVEGRLQEGRTVEEVRQAIANVAASDWHRKRGKHAGRDGGPKDDLTLICRNGDLFEGYRDMGGGSIAAIRSAAPITGEAEASRAWNAAKERLRQALPESTFDLWIAGMEAAGERQRRLVLVDTTGHGLGHFRGEWTERRYGALVQQAVADAGGKYSGLEILDETVLELEAA